jgi:hypothetical protein
MSQEKLHDSFIQIIHELGRLGYQKTNIAKLMGYTTTTQLNNVLEGKSLLSTKAIIDLVDNLAVNPIFLFQGKGQIFLKDKEEIEELRQENLMLKVQLTENNKIIEQLNHAIRRLEIRNADLIDLTSAAIKYHKIHPEDIGEDPSPSR